MKTIFESRNIIIALLTLVLSLAVWTYKGDQADIHKSNEAVKAAMKEGFAAMKEDTAELKSDMKEQADDQKESAKELSKDIENLSTEQRATALDVTRLKAIREAESNARRDAPER